MVCEPWTVPSGLKNLHAQTLKIPLAANESLLFEDSRPLLRYLFRRCASLIWTWQVLAMPATHVEWVFADISACTMPLRFSHSSKIKLSCMYRYIYIHNILNMCVCIAYICKWPFIDFPRLHGSPELLVPRQHSVAAPHATAAPRVIVPGYRT